VKCGDRLQIPRDEDGQAKPFETCPDYQGGSVWRGFGRRSYVCGGDEREGCEERQRGEYVGAVK
jgi:hypothetical protein